MSAKDVRVVIAGRDRGMIDFIATVTERQLGCKPQCQHIVNGHADPLHAQVDTPDLLVLDLAADWRAQLDALCARPAAARPALIVIGPASEPEAMRLAMRAGARDYLPAPVSPADLVQALDLMHFESTQRVEGDGHWTCVIGCRGGVGTSTIAAGLAELMQQQESTALLDLDLQGGTQSNYFDVEPRHHLLEALDTVADIDQVALDGFMTRTDSGIRLLAAPGFVTPPQYVPDSDVVRLFELTRSSYHYVVADVPRHLNSVSSSAIEQSDLVLLVVQQSVASVREALHMIDTVTREHDVSESRVRIVVNRFTKNASVTLAAIQKNVGDIEIWTVDNDYKGVSASLDVGAPVVTHAPSSAAAKSLRLICEHITGKRQRRGFVNSISQMLRM